ncbi:MAG TPA: ABC transporter ATP-binding protein [Candidatus Binatia bacterium]|nr:ABC transporter ATP-binding protein [Candidatus Binatia bacterium]
MRKAQRIDPEALKNAKVTRATLGRIWGFARAYRGHLVAYLVTIVLAALVGTLPPLVFKALIDNALPPGHHDPGLVNWLFLTAVALAVAITGLNLVNRWLASRIGEGLIYDLRVALYDHVQRMPIAFFTRTQTGSLMSRLSNDVLGAQQTVGTTASVTSDLFTLLFTLGVMLALSWKVTLLSLLVIPSFVLLDRCLAPRLAALSRRRMAINADMSSTLTERFGVSGALLVKLFGRPAVEAEEFSSRAARVRDSGIELAVMSRVYYGTLALGGALGTAAVYWLGGHAVIDGSIQIGTLTALVAYVARLYSPLTDLASARIGLLTALVSFDRVFEVLDAPRTITDTPGAVPLDAGGPVVGRIEVDEVWFRYPAPSAVSVASLEADGGPAEGLSADPSDLILRGVSFVAEPGQMVALVGPSGAGKTTLTSLIPRLYDVTSGAVRIDGRDIRGVTLQSLADAIGLVSQDPHLFHDTVAANLRYARPAATDAEVVQACQAARIHDVITALPDGYETMVGERGHRMSGGEKQRLAIARVLLKRPAIVVLDEATAHLDSENESQIQDALATALAGRTAIVIAHRLSTVATADQILVLDRGEIVERGRHDELLAAGGLYQDLYETQYAGVGARP